MTRVLVEVTHPIRWATVRRIVAVEPGGYCHGPVPVYVQGRRVRFIDCGRRLPRDEQCPACRLIVTVQPAPTSEPGAPAATGSVSRRS
ncbi:MAG: hypothetical protein GXX79_13460 [Actinomycetales bacterium]|nr:hypothetical protein [Actinomycetales bacterium]